MPSVVWCVIVCAVAGGAARAKMPFSLDFRWPLSAATVKSVVAQSSLNGRVLVSRVVVSRMAAARLAVASPEPSYCRMSRVFCGGPLGGRGRV